MGWEGGCPPPTVQPVIVPKGTLFMREAVVFQVSFIFEKGLSMLKKCLAIFCKPFFFFFFVLLFVWRGP